VVVDASAAIELLLGTPIGQRLWHRLATDCIDVAVPDLADVEVASALRKLVLQRRLGTDRATQALRHWRALDIERYGHHFLLDRIWQLRDNLSAYDAAYVALAEALDTVVLTTDRRLAQAPGVASRVQLLAGASCEGTTIHDAD